MTQPIPHQLKWACRRGMLELDMLFQGFLAKEYAELSEAEKSAFMQLLDYHDQDLYAFLFTHTVPENQALIPIVNRIRTYAQSKL